MPVSLLVALILAFGTDSVVTPTPVDPGEVPGRAAAVAGYVLVVGLVALGLALAVRIRLRWRGPDDDEAGPLHAWSRDAVGVLCLGGYAWVIFGLNWPGVVRSGLGLEKAVLVDEILILLPYLLARVAGWWGEFPADRAIRRARNPDQPLPGVGRHLILRTRQTLGLILPGSLLLAFGEDLAWLAWPEGAATAAFQLGLVVATVVIGLVLAPVFVRLSWPTRPLPAGPLRDRLEGLAARFSFRATDILVWDTGGSTVNAMLTGVVPGFRYVLLSDLLVDTFDPHEIAAVFGHEVGHVRHRHLNYYGFFVAMSFGVLMLVGDLVAGPMLQWIFPQLDEVVRASLILLASGASFVMVFGLLSRRFEHQADVFACRSVSCGQPDRCPPHPDPYADPRHHRPAVGDLCPVGIRIYANALERVASLNRTDPTAWSWLHGSIARRVAFVTNLEGHPETERIFQVGIHRLRIGLAVALVTALVLSYQTGAIHLIRP